MLTKRQMSALRAEVLQNFDGEGDTKNMFDEVGTSHSEQMLVMLRCVPLLPLIELVSKHSKWGEYEVWCYLSGFLQAHYATEAHKHA